MEKLNEKIFSLISIFYTTTKKMKKGIFFEQTELKRRVYDKYIYINNSSRNNNNKSELMTLEREKFLLAHKITTYRQS